MNAKQKALFALCVAIFEFGSTSAHAEIFGRLREIIAEGVERRVERREARRARRFGVEEEEEQQKQEEGGAVAQAQVGNRAIARTPAQDVCNFNVAPCADQAAGTYCQTRVFPPGQAEEVINLNNAGTLYVQRGDQAVAVDEQGVAQIGNIYFTLTPAEVAVADPRIRAFRANRRNLLVAQNGPNCNVNGQGQFAQAQLNAGFQGGGFQGQAGFGGQLGRNRLLFQPAFNANPGFNPGLQNFAPQQFQQPQGVGAATGGNPFGDDGGLGAANTVRPPVRADGTPASSHDDMPRTQFVSAREVASEAVTYATREQEFASATPVKKAEFEKLLPSDVEALTQQCISNTQQTVTKDFQLSVMKLKREESTETELAATLIPVKKGMVGKGARTLHDSDGGLHAGSEAGVEFYVKQIPGAPGESAFSIKWVDHTNPANPVTMFCRTPGAPVAVGKLAGKASVPVNAIADTQPTRSFFQSMKNAM